MKEAQEHIFTDIAFDRSLEELYTIYDHHTFVEPLRAPLTCDIKVPYYVSPNRQCCCVLQQGT